jgi:hypothetical protein
LGIFFVGDDVLVVNLFGDVVSAPHDGPGRPAHHWSRENSNKVLLAFARGLSVKEAAMAIGVSAPTLRKVYFAEVSERAKAKLRMEMTQLARLNRAAEAGSVPAEKELLKTLERMRQRDVVDARAPTHPTKAVPVGIKAAKAAAAKQVDGLYGTRTPPPSALN